MPKLFYTTEEFIALNDEWYAKLAKEGFKDIEAKDGNLKQQDTRTIGFSGVGRSKSSNIRVQNTFANQAAIRGFFQALDDYLTNTTDKIKPLHRRILELYAEGVPVEGVNGILKQVGMSPKSSAAARKVIKKYQRLILDRLSTTIDSD